MSSESDTDRLGRRIPAVYPAGRTSYGVSPNGLSVLERVCALIVFVLWLGIFAGGIIVDTRPYRVAISAGGVAALEAPAMEQAAPAGVASVPPTLAFDPPGLLESWVVVLLWFLPLNLALLCAASGVLGAYGNRANLHDDHSKRTPADNSNPYISALLRGFFVYLIMISGLLLLDDAPFSNPTPGQYIRLAGLLSLFSFVVNYNPSVFSRLLMIAAERMQRSPKGAAPYEEREVEIERAAVEVTRVHAATEVSEDGGAATPGRPRQTRVEASGIRMDAEAIAEVVGTDGGFPPRARP